MPEADSPADIFADSVSLDSVSVALAAIAAIKIDSIGIIPADGAIGNRVSIALAIPAIKIDAQTSIPADGAIGNGVPIALAIPAIKKDAIPGVIGNQHQLNPAVVHILAV